jgi:hypothetical protein
MALRSNTRKLHHHTERKEVGNGRPSPKKKEDLSSHKKERSGKRPFAAKISSEIKAGTSPGRRDRK